MNTAPRKIKTRKKQYPFIGFRPTKSMDERLRRLARKEKCGLSRLIERCLMANLPALEMPKMAGMMANQPKF